MGEPSGLYASAPIASRAGHPYPYLDSAGSDRRERLHRAGGAGHRVQRFIFVSGRLSETRLYSNEGYRPLVTA